MSESSVPRISAIGLLPPVALAPVVVTRPNDAIAYAIGDVFGTAADGRIEIAGMTPGRRVFAVRLYGVNTRSASDPTLTLNLLPFLAQPATVIGDNSRLDLSDADIVLAATAGGITGTTATQMTFSANGTQWLNGNAGTAGRKAASGILFNSGMTVPASGSIWLYPFVTSAYAPLALESVTLYSFVIYDGG